MVTTLRRWRRRHVNGVTGEVIPIPGIGSWEVSMLRPEQPAVRLPQHFALLTEAQAFADRKALAVLDHDCSRCEQWTAVTAVKRRR